jgi:hypothetical protein
MSKRGAVLAGRIMAELNEVSILVERIEIGMQKAKTQNDDFYLDSVALNLHGFYSGVERLFEKIAGSIDGSMPEGANWHQELLNQMAIEVPGVRPAVISVELKGKLEEYRGFRHVVRNVYTYHLDPDKLKPLVKTIRSVMKKLEKELSAFARFIQKAE